MEQDKKQSLYLQLYQNKLIHLGYMRVSFKTKRRHTYKKSKHLLQIAV